ncbi:hypothetical protein [Lelliottia nimipressuralis]|uniref:Uncharacterized protein n=1 Tax=Lelliottia nimipressuralis TaxID=69220 RepID=A0ABD4K7X0_9ENTR|nr:hypothetical protein [Lelliottia nimipressuralis]MBF4177255.1 hypothetical protein [Lelliottia nimipressuralis]
MSFRTVTGLGSPQYGRKAARLIAQRIAKYGSIRAYYAQKQKEQRNG